MLGQPAFVLGDAGGDAEGEALLPQQGVSSVAAAEGQDLPGVWQVRYQHLVWVAGPRVDRRSWRADRWTEGKLESDTALDSGVERRGPSILRGLNLRNTDY